MASTIEDPWHWLRDPGYPAVDDPDVLAYLEAENAYFESVHGPGGRVAGDDPRRAERPHQARRRLACRRATAHYEYWWQFEPGDQYRTWLRRAGRRAAPKQLMLSEPALAEGHDYFRLSGASDQPRWPAASPMPPTPRATNASR